MLIKYAPDFVKDQGYHGTCVSMALSGIAQSWYKKVTGKVIEMSSGYIAAYSRPAAPRVNSQGVDTVDALTAFITQGTCPSYEFDYNGHVYQCWIEAEKAKAQDKIKTIIKPIKGFKSVNFADRDYKLVNTMKILTKTNLPMIATYNDGGENHTVPVIGVDGDRLIILNSRGKKLGNNGVMTIPIAPLKYLFEIEYSDMIVKELGDINFKDVKENDWFYNAVEYAYKNGLMKGKSEDTFEPNATLTRAELAQVLYNMRDDV